MSPAELTSASLAVGFVQDLGDQRSSLRHMDTDNGLHGEMTDAADAAARTVANVRRQPVRAADPVHRLGRAYPGSTTSSSGPRYSLEARAHGESVGQDLIDRDFAADPGFAAGYRAQLDRALDRLVGPGQVGGLARRDGLAHARRRRRRAQHRRDGAARLGPRRRHGAGVHGQRAAAAAALRAVEANAELFRQYKGFAEPVEVPPSASVLDQVLALSGRDPAWTPAPGA